MRTIRSFNNNCRRQSLLAALAMVFTVGAAFAGPPKPAPPIRTGLWEQQHTQTLNGMDFDLPPFLVEQARDAGIDMADDGRSERLCITPENITEIGQPTATQLPACRKQNVKVSKHGLSLDLICGDNTGSGSGHVEMVFDSDTYYHGHFVFTGTHQLFGDNMLPLEVAGEAVGHWLSPSCQQNP